MGCLRGTGEGTLYLWRRVLGSRYLQASRDASRFEIRHLVSANSWVNFIDARTGQQGRLRFEVAVLFGGPSTANPPFDFPKDRERSICWAGDTCPLNTSASRHARMNRNGILHFKSCMAGKECLLSPSNTLPQLQLIPLGAGLDL
jgi:hypothetical protein